MSLLFTPPLFILFLLVSTKIKNYINKKSRYEKQSDDRRLIKSMQYRVLVKVMAPRVGENTSRLMLKTGEYIAKNGIAAANHHFIPMDELQCLK